MMQKLRRGHAAGYLREALLEVLDASDEADWPETVDLGDETVPFRRLIGQLWNRTDCCPAYACETVDLPTGSTYAKVVRKIRGSILQNAR